MSGLERAISSARFIVFGAQEMKRLRTDCLNTFMLIPG